MAWSEDKSERTLTLGPLGANVEFQLSGKLGDPGRSVLRRI